MKSVPDDIHDLAGVPSAKNEHLYRMTVEMISAAMDSWEKDGLSFNEQKAALGKKKDELISELISLRERGIAIGDIEGAPRAAARVVSMADIRKAG